MVTLEQVDAQGFGLFFITDFFDSEHGLTYFLVKASVLGFGNTMIIEYVVFNHFLTMV